MPRLVSILGMSRSGSTLLGLMLGQRRGVLFVGEMVTFGAAWAQRGARCSCRAVVHDCPFWLEVVGRAGLANVPSEITPDMACRLMDAAAELTGADVVVDSSKHPGWQLAVQRGAQREACAVHIVRDPRGHLVLAHHGWFDRATTSDPPSLGAGLRIALVWVRRNWWATVARRRWDEHARVRYEDLVDTGPMGVPAEWLGPVDPSWGGAAHIATGNRKARRRPLGEVEEDTRWLDKVPRRVQAVMWLTGFPLTARYRYPIVGPRTR